MIGRVTRWGAVGAALGAVAGLMLAVVSLVAGGGTWAGMFLLGTVLSWPAGLLLLEPLAGVSFPGAGYVVIVAGPALNGAVLGAVLGGVIWLLDRA